MNLLETEPVSTMTIEGFRLSPQQKRVWIAQQNSDGQPPCVQAAILIEGALNPNTLKEAVHQVVLRNEILRTVFHRRPGTKTPFQVVLDRIAFSWEQIDHTGLNPAAQLVAVEELFQQKLEQPFDFEHGPLLRVSLVAQQAERHTLIVNLPATCADKASLRNLVAEISAAYAGFRNGQELSSDQLQYVDYC